MPMRLTLLELVVAQIAPASMMPSMVHTSISGTWTLFRSQADKINKLR